jgi:signal recognition particle subunit SRP54
MSALEKLGASLTNALRKIIKTPLIDENTVKELVKDFQRALLQADVNVQLVLDLTNRIKERTLKEKLPPGISRRDHVIKVIYEELTKFVGKTPAKIIVEPGRVNIFMLVGIQGSGKCVVGNSKVSMVNWPVMTIAKLFEEQIGCCDTAIILQDGIALQPRNLRAYSINLETLKMEERPVEWIWKLKATKELYEVLLDSTTNPKIITTPEHPFFTFNKGNINRVRADKLKIGQYVMVPSIIQKNIPLNCEKTDTGSFSTEEEKIKYEQATIREPLKTSLYDITQQKTDIHWIKIKDIHKKSNHSIDYVYDLTIKDHHNFIANNIIVQNTTSSAKIARYFQKRGFKTALICADTYRLGAFAQLKQLAKDIHVPVYGKEGGEDVLTIVAQGVEDFTNEGYEVIIIDTAGRHKDEKKLIQEMKKITQTVNPNEIILVIDATIGQQATLQAKAFHEATKIGSIFITKLDGTARGGGALSAVASIGVPIKFVGTGEKLENLDLFVPSRFVGRLLGMGDINGLIQKVKEAEITLPEKKTKAILRGRFTLDDMYSQMEAMKSMGPLRHILKMIPGMGYKLPKDTLENAEHKLKKWRYIIQSMTTEEKLDPKILKSSRIKRISKGSGTTEREVKDLIKQYNAMKKLMKSIGKRRLPPMLKKMFDRA